MKLSLSEKRIIQDLREDSELVEVGGGQVFVYTKGVKRFISPVTLKRMISKGLIKFLLEQYGWKYYVLSQASYHIDFKTIK